jgi:hypothetical protein
LQAIAFVLPAKFLIFFQPLLFDAAFLLPVLPHPQTNVVYRAVAGLPA